jgi:hypothetical protein
MTLKRKRFLKNVDKHGPIPQHLPALGPCWVWPTKDSKGNAMAWFNGELMFAHRASYILQHAVDPGNAARACNNRLCVNPDHVITGQVTEFHVEEDQPRSRFKLTDEQATVIRALRDTEQFPLKKLAQWYGVSVGAIKRVVRNETHHNPAYKPVENIRGNSVTNWKDIADIRKMYASHEYSQEEVGEHFGISRSLVNMIVRNDIFVDPNYKYVPRVIRNSNTTENTTA